MIEMLNQSTGKVFGMRVSGKLLHQDYERFVPLLEKLIEEHGSVRCLVEMTDLHGIELRALWDEIKFHVPPCQADRALRRCRRPCLGGLDDQAVTADLFECRDPVLRRHRAGSGLGVDSGGARQ